MKKKLIIVFQVLFFIISLLFWNNDVLADMKFSSDKYLISGEYIKHVNLNTNKDNFVSAFNYSNATLNFVCDNGKNYVGTLCQLKLKDLSMIERSYFVIVNGDVTGDGEDTITDIVKIALHTNEKNKFTDNAFVLASDVNGDDLVSNDDVDKLSYHNVVGGDNIIFNDKTVAQNFELVTKSLVLSKGSSSEIVIKKNKADVSIISWESSNKNVVTVDETGKVTAVGAGNAVITVKSKDGESVSLEVGVVVVVPDTGVSLTKVEEMDVNTTKKLTATISPADCTNKKITWTSSDKTIATISSDGVVKALKSGKVTITATTATGKTDSITINVIVPTSKIVLDKTTVNLKVSESSTITATVSPSDATNKSVIWSSSNTDVATVDTNGKVTAIKTGDAVITATTVDGKQKATCKVTVEKLKLSISNSNLSLIIDDTKQLTTTLSVDNIDDTVTWSSSNTAIAVVDANGKVTAKKAGTAIITAKLDYDPNVKVECEVIVKELNLSISNSKLDLVSISSKQLKTTLSVDTVDDSVTWSSSNTAVASVDANGKVTAKKAGTAIITAKLKDKPNITVSSNVTVSAARFLFVGNSKTFYPETVNDELGIPKRLKDIASEQGYEIECYYAVVPGVALGTIINANDSRNKISIIKNDYDYVVLNEGTATTHENYTSYYNHVNKIKGWVEDINSNVNIYVRKIWIRIKQDENGLPAEGSTLEQIETSYKNADKLALALGVNTINDGALFYDTMDNYSNIHIMRYQDGVTDDFVHQNANGAYLAALCFYSEIFDKDPTEVSYDAGITSTVANTLKKQAKKFCYKN